MSKNTEAKVAKQPKPQKPVNPPKPVVFEIPEPVVQVMLNYIASSIPQKMTVQEAVNLSMALQRLKRINDADN